jgi:hypothetical protein
MLVAYGAGLPAQTLELKPVSVEAVMLEIPRRT